MYVDNFGMPVQRDGDPMDQLNRVACMAITESEWYIKLGLLRAEPPSGVYVRHVGGNPNNVSGDQLVPVFATHAVSPGPYSKIRFGELCLAMFKRFGFAQNTHDTDGSRKLLPDFILHRVLPFISRVYFGHTIVCLLDTVLLLNTIATVIDLKLKNDPDHVDPFVNAVATLVVCNIRHPTPISSFCLTLLEQGALENTGFKTEGSRVSNGLAWYHRADSGGNPMVGQIQIRQWELVQ